MEPARCCARRSRKYLGRAGRGRRKEEKKVLGETGDYLTKKTLHNDMRVMPPPETAALAGPRRVTDEHTEKRVLGVVQEEFWEIPKNGNRRFKHNRDKI